MYRANLTPLTDCAVHGAGSGAELSLVEGYQVQHYRSLASMTGRTLATTCLDPATRNHRPLGPDDAQTALAQLGAISVESHAAGQSESSEPGGGRVESRE